MHLYWPKTMCMQNEILVCKEIRILLAIPKLLGTKYKTKNVNFS